MVLCKYASITTYTLYLSSVPVMVTNAPTVAVCVCRFIVQVSNSVSKRWILLYVGPILVDILQRLNAFFWMKLVVRIVRRDAFYVRSVHGTVQQPTAKVTVRICEHERVKERCDISCEVVLVIGECIFCVNWILVRNIVWK